MSQCMTLLNKHELIMSCDSRESSKDEYGNKVIRSDASNKIEIIHNKVIFGAGAAQLIQKVWKEYGNQKNGSIHKLAEIAQKWEKEFCKFWGDDYMKNNFFYPDGKMTLNLTIGMIEGGLPVVYSLNAYNGFQLVKSVPKENKITVSSSGCNNQKFYDFVVKNAKEGRMIDSVIDAYNTFSDVNVGGMLSIFRITKQGIELIYKDRIVDKMPITYVKDSNCVFAEPLLHVAKNAYVEGIIESSTISSSIINGGTWQTSSSGKRIVVSGNQLNSYNGTTKEGFAIEAYPSSGIYGGLIYGSGSLYGGLVSDGTNLILYGNASLNKNLYIQGGQNLYLQTINNTGVIEIGGGNTAGVKAKGAWQCNEARFDGLKNGNGDKYLTEKDAQESMVIRFA